MPRVPHLLLPLKGLVADSPLFRRLRSASQAFRDAWRPPPETAAPVVATVAPPAPPAANADDLVLFAELMREYLPYAPWWIDDVRTGEDAIEVVGWALTPGGQPEAMTFTCNQTPFDEVDYPLPRNLSPTFPHVAGADRAGFRLRTSRPEHVRGDVPLRIERIWRESLLPVAAHSAFHLPAAKDEPPLPEPERMHRVSGNRNANVFRVAGYSAWVELEGLLRRHFDRGYDGFPAILDWGLGCGRLARHFRNSPKVEVVGADVDADNVAWCARTLPFVRAETLPLHPPTTLSAGHFDLVIGISVMTHLREREQEEWLAELRRITKPGAILLLTTLGAAAVAWLNSTPAVVHDWLSRSILFGRDNDQLEGRIAETGYYTDTYLHHSYIAARWSAHFEVIAIERGFLFGHQDVVVLRRRSD